MKYDYYLQIGKEEKKFNSKREALEEAIQLVNGKEVKDVILFSKCKGERIDTIPSVLKYLQDGGTVNAAPKKPKAEKKVKAEGELVVKPSKLDRKIAAKKRLASNPDAPVQAGAKEKGLTGKSWVQSMGLTVRPKPKESK